MEELGSFVLRFADIIAALVTGTLSIWISLKLKLDLFFNPAIGNRVERHVARSACLVLSAVTLGISVGFARFYPDAFPWLHAILLSSGLLLVMVLICLSLRALLIYQVVIGHDEEAPTYANALGGFVLSEEAKRNREHMRTGNRSWLPATFLRASVDRLDLVWTRGSRVISYFVMVSATISIIVSSTATLCFLAGWLVASQPRPVGLNTAAQQLAGINEWAVKSTNTIPLPQDYARIRNSFGEAWSDSSAAEKVQVTPDTLSKAFGTQILICRDEEAHLGSLNTAHEWAKRAIEFFQGSHLMRPYLARAQLQNALTYNQEINYYATDFSRRREIIEGGLKAIEAGKTLYSDMKADEFDKAGGDEQYALLLRTSASLHYEKAKPERDDEATSWDREHLKISIADAAQAKNHTKNQWLHMVPYLRPLRRLVQIDATRWKPEVEAVIAQLQPLLSQKDVHLSGHAKVALFNSVAVVVHEYVLGLRNSETQGIRKLIELHTSLSIDLMSTVVAMADTPGAASAAVEKRIGDFLFDLARMHCLQADLKRTVGEDPTNDVRQVEKLLLRIDTHDSIPSTMRRRLLLGVFQWPEFSQYLDRPALEAIVSYARLSRGTVETTKEVPSQSK